MTTANATRPTKTKAGAPNYHGLYKNALEEQAAERKAHKALQRTLKENLTKLDLERQSRVNLENDYRGLKLQNDVLTAEAEREEEEGREASQTLNDAILWRNIYIGICFALTALVWLSGAR